MFGGFFVLWYVCLQSLSFLLVGDAWRSVFESTYGHVLGWIDLNPNLGLQWYLCMQLFSRFRRYFVILINGLSYAFLVPLTVRLYRYPMVLVRMKECCDCVRVSHNYPSHPYLS